MVAFAAIIKYVVALEIVLNLPLKLIRRFERR